MALIRKHQALKEEQARREAAAEEEAEAVAAAAGKGGEDDDDEEKTEEEETEALTLVPAHRAGQPSEGSLLSLGAGSAAEEEDEQPPLASTGLLSTASLDGSGGAGSVGSGRTAVLKFAPSARVDLLRSDSMDSAVSPGTPLALMEEELRMARETADAETDAARAAAGRPPLPVPPTGAGRRQRHRTSDSASSFLSLSSSGGATNASQQAPTVPAFAVAAEALLAKARFVLAVLGDHPAAAPDDDIKGDDDHATTTVHDARLQACAELLLAQDLQDVGQLQQLLARRRARAACRRHGLRCYRALIRATAGLSSVQAHAIAHLRAAMAPQALLLPAGSAGVAASEAQAPEAQQQQVPPAAAAASASGSRALVGAGGHHYLAGLEGIPPPLADAVRRDFVALYSALLGLVGRALEGRHVALACQALAAWALDFRPGGGQDAAFLLRAGVPSKLAGLLSLPGLVRCLGAAGEDGAPQQWVAWPLQDVRAGLNEGRLTKRMVLEHMRACPEGGGGSRSTKTKPRAWAWTPSWPASRSATSSGATSGSCGNPRRGGPRRRRGWCGARRRPRRRHARRAACGTRTW